MTTAHVNDTGNGTPAGTTGQIKVTTAGGTGTGNLDFTSVDARSGVFQEITVHYVNTGTNAQDVYLVFPNAEALHAVNNLGHYGEARITSNGATIFFSANLDDGEQANLTPVPEPSRRCSGAPGAQVPLSPTGCWPIPGILKLASNLAPGQGGTMTFGFAPVLTPEGTSPAGLPFCYPLVPAPGSANPLNQVCTTSGAHFGLPYQIVATQPGIAPANPDDSSPAP